MFLAFVSLLLLTTLISLIIFGGGQIFLPVFQWIWNLLDSNLINLNEENFNLVITVSNSTPGIFSEKMAFFTGLLVSKNLFLGIFLGIIILLAFILPAILIMELAWLYLRRIPNYKKIVRNLLPVIAGILLSVTVKIFIKTLIPWLKFNTSSHYFLLVEKAGKDIHSQSLAFFTGFRLYILILWTVISIPSSYFLMERKNISGIKVIIVNAILCFVVFQPWL